MDRDDLTGMPALAESIAAAMLNYAADLEKKIYALALELPASYSADNLANADFIRAAYTPDDPEAIADRWNRTDRRTDRRAGLPSAADLDAIADDERARQATTTA
jgi:hypothetical protein